MVTKHFWKVLIVFIGIILLGVISAFIISYLDKEGEIDNSDVFKNMADVAK
jgi:uncharacterized membrane protein YwzB